MDRDENSQSFAVGEECIVAVETTSGNVDIEGWQEARVQVEGPESEVRVQQEGATLRIHARRGGSKDIRVRAPQYSNVELRSVSGDVRVSNIAGDVTLQTTSGDVEIQRVRGRLRAHTVSGDLKVRQSELSSLGVDTVSGDIVIESMLEAQGEYDVRGVSGDFKLAVPAGQGLTVYSSSLSGDFRSELPHEVVEQSRRKVEARINGGGPAFRVRSTSGDVWVTEVKGAAVEEKPVAAPQPAVRVQAERPFADQVRPPSSPVVRETKPLPTEPAAGPEPFAVEERAVPRAGTEEAPPAPSQESAASRRLEILKAIEEGRMSVSEGLAKLRNME